MKRKENEEEGRIIEWMNMFGKMGDECSKQLINKKYARVVCWNNNLINLINEFVSKIWKERRMKSRVE